LLIKKTFWKALQRSRSVFFTTSSEVARIIYTSPWPVNSFFQFFIFAGFPHCLIYFSPKKRGQRPRKPGQCLEGQVRAL
jgi:hypothetical protein